MQEQSEEQSNFVKKEEEVGYFKLKLLTFKDITFHPIKFLEKLLNKDSIADTVSFYLKSFFYFGFGFFLPFYLFFSSSYPLGKAIVISLVIIFYCNLIPITIAMIFFPIILHLLIKLFRGKSRFRNTFNASVSAIGIFLSSFTTISLGCWFIIKFGGMIIGFLPTNFRIVGNSLLIALILIGYCFLSVLMPVLIFITLKKFHKFSIFKSIVTVIIAFSIISFSEVIFNKGGQLAFSKFGKNIFQYVYVGESEDVSVKKQKSIADIGDDNPRGLYIQAREKFIFNKDKDLRERMNDILDNGWHEDTQVRELLAKNKDALDLIKKATKLKSNGYIFVLPPEKIDVTMEIPSYWQEIEFFKFLLIEARSYEYMQKHDLAQENYLTAARLIEHLSEEKVRTLISFLMEIIIFDDGYKNFIHTIEQRDFSIEYYITLQKTLERIRNNHDFLKKSFEIEEETQKNIFKLIESEFNNHIADITNGSKDGWKDIKNAVIVLLFKRQIIDKSIAQFQNTFNPKCNTVFSIWISSSKNNTPELATDSAWELIKKGENFYLEMLRSKKMFSFETLATKFADHSLFLCLPNYAKSIIRAHIYYNKLNIVIVSIALKRYLLDNGKFPNQLNQLVPDYLNKIPEDTYNNFQPLSYENQGDRVVVYSFGPDRDDDHAKTAFDQAEFFNNLSLNDGDISFSFSMN